MPRTRLQTYQDTIDHLADYGGATSSLEMERVARRAILLAYNNFSTSRKWSYLYTRGRIVTHASQTSGTISYTASTRVVSLSSSTFPSWAALGNILINNIVYNIESNPSSTTVVLDESTGPASDIAAGTTYTLYQDSYTLPCDFVSTDEIVNLNFLLSLTMQHPAEWLGCQRLIHGPAVPAICTITGDPKFYGALCLRLFPPPDNAYTLDFVYQRSPRQLNTILYNTGTVICTQSSLAVVGTNTSWNQNMVGAVIRFSSGATDTPTSVNGASPSAVERMVTGLTDATHLTIDVEPAQTLTGVKHAISDPIDFEDSAMQLYFLRECERQFRTLRRMEPTAVEEKQYQESMFQAWEADSRSTERRAAGGGMPWRPRMANMPRGADVS